MTLPFSEVVVLLLGGAGWAFFFTNKLPKRLYEGKGLLARLLNCAFCAGTEIGWVLAGALLLAYLAVPWLRPALLMICAGPAVGVVATLVQKLSQTGTALQELAKKEDE